MAKKTSFFFNDLDLSKKITTVLALVLLGGVVMSGIALSRVLTYSVQDQISSKALMLIGTMNSVRTYTSNEVKPELIDQLDTVFLPETVPAYSAREVFENLRKDANYQDFYYKEATLNPTNPRDKADPFEATLVEDFRRNGELNELHGFRTTAGSKVFYIAHPLKVNQASCLECHGQVEAAPKSMIERYGTQNGFGWQMDEVVGAQIISVPASKVFIDARKSFLLIMSIVLAAFGLAIFIVNLCLDRFVVRPLRRMAQVAEVVSMGDMNAEFQQKSNDEVGKLAAAFERMKMSFKLALQRLEQQRLKYRDH